MVFNTFGPIAFAVQFSHGWTDSTLAMMATWGSIAFVVSLVPMTLFLQKTNLRSALILNTFFTLLGTTVRTLSSDSDTFVIFCHIGAFLNGVAGVLVMSAPPLVTALWFPERERIFATSISQERDSPIVKHYS
jgi:FLVCR family MFS transporter